jgi:hypothetical protein
MQVSAICTVCVLEENGNFFLICDFFYHESVLCVFSSQRKSRTKLGKLSIILLFLTSLLVILASLTGKQDIFCYKNIPIFSQRNDDILFRSCLLAERGNVLAA